MVNENFNKNKDIFEKKIILKLYDNITLNYSRIKKGIKKPPLKVVLNIN